MLSINIAHDQSAPTCMGTKGLEKDGMTYVLVGLRPQVATTPADTNTALRETGHFC